MANKRGRKSAAQLSVVPLHNPHISEPSPPPKHLSKAAKEWWYTFVETELNSRQYSIMECAASAWQRMEEAREAVAKNGLSYEDDKGMHRARPEVQIERDSRVAFLRALRELKLIEKHDEEHNPTFKPYPPALYDR